MQVKKKLDYSDYAAIPDDGCRYEMVDGDFLVMPARVRRPKIYRSGGSAIAAEALRNNAC